VDATEIVSIFLRGALGGRGRKRARRAVSFLTGHRGFLTASTVLGAAGVAWGIYDSLKSSGAQGAQGSQGSVGATGAVGATATQGATGPMPPIPGMMSDASVLPSDVVRIVRLAVSAARADGELSPQERALILEHARAAGIETVVEQELAASRPLAEIVRGVTDASRQHDLYVLGFAIVRADESVSGAERIYLAQLAHQLGIDPLTAARLEQTTAATIDSTPPEPPLDATTPEPTIDSTTPEP
jgi:uncharacterized membrane protein YebE (DUF533 family)